VRASQAATAIGKQQLRVAVGLPEAAQHAKGDLRQGHEAVAVAFGVANMHAVAIGINVTDPQGQPFAQAQPHAVQGEVKHPVAQNAGARENLLRLLHSQDVGQALGLGWFDEIGHVPRLSQYVLGVELVAIQIVLDGAPGVGINQAAEIVGQLGGREIVDLVVKVVAHVPDGAAVSIDAFGLKALEFEVLEVGLVALIKFGFGCKSLHAGVFSRWVTKSPRPN